MLQCRQVRFSLSALQVLVRAHSCVTPACFFCAAPFGRCTDLLRDLLHDCVDIELCDVRCGESRTALSAQHCLDAGEDLPGGARQRGRLAGGGDPARGLRPGRPGRVQVRSADLALSLAQDAFPRSWKDLGRRLQPRRPGRDQVRRRSAGFCMALTLQAPWA